MRVLPTRLQAPWIAAGGSWGATACVLVGAAVLTTTATYIPVFGTVRDESVRWGFNPLPWLALGLLTAAATWGLMFGLFALPRGRHTTGDSRRLASEMLIMLAPLPLLANLVQWLIQ